MWQDDNTLHVEAYRNYSQECITKVAEFSNSALNMNGQND
jgi:hypothetical protein